MEQTSMNSVVIGRKKELCLRKAGHEGLPF